MSRTTPHQLNVADLVELMGRSDPLDLRNVRKLGPVQVVEPEDYEPGQPGRWQALITCQDQWCLHAEIFRGETVQRIDWEINGQADFQGGPLHWETCVGGNPCGVHLLGDYGWSRGDKTLRIHQRAQQGRLLV